MKKVLFHTGRGGRFNNAGHVTAEGVIGEFNPEYFGINIYFNDNEENPEIRLDNGEVVCNLNDLYSDNGSFNNKYRTIKLSIEEFQSELNNTENDWNQFLKSSDYYIVK